MDEDYTYIDTVAEFNTHEKLCSELGNLISVSIKDLYEDGDKVYARMKYRIGDNDLVVPRLITPRDTEVSILSETQGLIDAEAFSLMKPNDAVIVGMYPEYEDQVAINAEYVRRFHPSSRSL